MNAISISKMTFATFVFMFSVGAIAGNTGTNAEFEACRQKLIKAQNLDLLYDLKWERGQIHPKVVVGRTFYNIPIDAKEGFAETVNCFLMSGETDKFIDFEITDWKTGRPVGSFKNGRYKHY